MLIIIMGLALGVPLCKKQLRLLPVEPDPTSIGVGMSVKNVCVLIFSQQPFFASMYIVVVN